MESLTYLKNIQLSPKKLRFILPEIKKLNPVAALDYLLYSPNKSAKIMHKAVKSAINNAKNTLKVSEDVLKFRVFTIEQGQTLKRYQPGSRGTAKPVLKRYSHIKIILESVDVQPEQTKGVRIEKKIAKEDIKIESANAEVKAQKVAKAKTDSKPKKTTEVKKVKSQK